MTTEFKVLEVLKTADAPMRPGEIAEKAEISKADADKAIQKLKKEEQIFSPKRCFYAIKK